MDTSVFIALMNPGMSLIFAAAFFLLWRHQRHRRYILLLSMSLLAITSAFLLQYFTVYDIAATKLASNLLFLAGGCGFVLGGLGRYDRKPPLGGVVTFAFLGAAVFVWFLFVQPDLTLRIYAINFSFGAITLVMAVELRGMRDRKLIDNLLLGITTTYGITSFIRPVLVIWIEGAHTSYENFHESLYWITLTSSGSFFLLLFALTLITAIALDAMEELRHESQTDPLSGLLNRRGFEDGVGEALRVAKRRQMPAALIICDLDHFKSVNDTHGHAAGDRVIATFADCLRGCVGPNHVVGRIGGEEFAILLHGVNLGAGRLFAEGVRAAFGVLSVPGLPSDMRFSASFGVAEWRPGESVAQLFVRADRALYEAKNAGRDCVRVDKPRRGGTGYASDLFVKARPQQTR